MSGLVVGSSVIGVDDPLRAAAFWTAALDYVVVQPADPGFTLLRPRDGPGPQLALMPSSTPPSSHPRQQLDLYAADPVGEVDRLLTLGATRVPDWDGYGPDSDFVVLEDTEGNRFCVIDKA